MTDKLMFCLIEDNNLLGKYNISADTKKKKTEINWEPVYNKTFFENQNKILW